MQRIVGFKKEGRQAEDFYATPDWAIYELLKREDFPDMVWEPASGNGAISKILENAGYEVYSSDIRTDDDVYGDKGVDFLKLDLSMGSIVTNPPFRLSLEFALHAFDCAKKVALLERVQFLEGKTRYLQLFSKYPPVRIYPFVQRVKCYMGGDSRIGGAGVLAFAWFVWEAGFTGKPTIDWIYVDKPYSQLEILLDGDKMKEE